MFKLEGLDVVGGILQQSFLPIIVPAILFAASVASWAYLVSKNKAALKKYWVIPLVLLIAAIAIAVAFHRWGRVSY